MKHVKPDSSSEDMTLQTIKKQLSDMGLSTATEGLGGDDRYEELRHRLLKAKGMVSERLSSSSSSSSSNFNSSSSTLSQLTIGEIRSRLTDLGESTSTPGLVGEERRIELMRRLTMSICGSDTDRSNAIIDDMIDRKMMKANDDKMEFITKAPDPPAPSPMTTQTIEHTDGDDRNGLDVTITNGDISEIKKTLKRILNKRAIAVAARLSGTNQDPDLKEHEKNLSKAEAELARLRVQKQQSSSTTISSSSILVDGGNKMPVDKLIQKLENLKIESKEQIRVIRLRIREEVDQHHEYGTVAEEELQAALRNANYTKGRTRRKIDEIKAMNTGKSVKGSNDDGDKNDDKTKPVHMKEPVPVKSKNVNLPPTKVKSMENGLDSRWDNLEALGNKQKKEFEELMADLGHEDDLFDLRGLSDEILKPKDMPPTSSSVKEPEQMVLSKPSSNDTVATATINYTKSTTSDYRNKASTLPPTKIIDYNDEEGEDEDDDNEDNDDDGSDDEDGEEETVTHYSPPPTAEPVLKEKPSLIKRLLEEQEKERQAMTLKRNELSAASDDNDDDNDDKYDPDMNYISNIYENLQPVPSTAPTSPKPLGSTNPSSSRSDVASPRSPRTEAASLSSKMISPVDTNTSNIVEKRKPPPPNQPPSHRPPQSPTAKSSKKPELTVDTSSRPITANENVSRPQTAPATPKTPLGGNSKFGKSKEDADIKVQSPKITTNTVANDSDDDDDDDDDDDEADGDNREQVKTLLKHAKVLEGLGDLISAESMYARALELNPLDVSSLNSYAVFLHNKRGELTRAESFFGRAIHTIFPGLYEAVCVPNPDKIPRPPPVFDLTDGKHDNELKDKPALSKTKYKVVVNCLLNYAGFLSRAKGDIESAQFVYSKALQVASSDAKVLGIVAHFLAEEGGNSKKAADIFARAMKLDPNNSKHAMWYAKVLKKQGKSGQAELMYMVALQKSQGDKKIEPTAICNYATYIFKHKKDKVKAQQMFIEGLEKYPGHKGLVKNYSTLLKANPNMGSSESLRQPTPMSAKSRLRVDSAIKAALDRIQSPIPLSSSGPVLSRASSSSAFTFMATGFDASRVTTPDIVELKKVVNRKLTPHATNRKTLAGTSAAFDDYDDSADYSIAQGMKLESDKVVVETNLSNVKDSWMFENNGFFSSSSPGNEGSDDDSDEDLYKAPISPSKKK